MIKKQMRFVLNCYKSKLQKIFISNNNQQYKYTNVNM